MQPNQFPAQQFTPNNNVGGLQPNVYYAVQQPTPPQAPTYTKKNPLGLIIALVFFVIATVALGSYVIVDKFIFVSTAVDDQGNLINNLTIPLSSVDTSKDENAYKNALVGRIFTTDNSFEQTIKFTSDTEYDLNYYKNPIKDIASYDISVSHGTYTVSDNTITLSDGDSFSIVNDYLVKKSDGATKNSKTVYFDSYQLPSVANNTNKALKKFLATWGGEKSLDADKVHISNMRCATSSSHLTNADNYICNTDFTIYFSSTNIDKILKDQKLQDFKTLCNSVDTLKFYAGTCSTEDYAITTSRNLVIRITNGEYRIIGAYTDEEEKASSTAESKSKDTQDQAQTDDKQ